MAFLEEFVHYERRPKKNGNKDPRFLRLYILSQHHLYISFSLYRSLISPYLSHGLVAWRQPANSHLHKLLVLQKRILRLICFSKTKEHAVPLFISSNLLPLHMLYFETVSTLMHGYKTRSSNSGTFYISISKTNQQLYWFI